jgi:hypothetical protein
MGKRIITAGLFTVGLIALAGCNPITLSQEWDEPAVTTAAAYGVAAEANAVATSMTVAQVSANGGAIADLARAEVISGCPAVKVKTTGSGGAWTDEVLTFDTCTFNGARGYTSLAVSGQVELSRTSTDGLSFTSNATKQVWAFTNASGVYSETRNGNRVITATADSASVADNVTTVFSGSKYDGTMDNLLTAAFTPKSGSTLAASQPLPSGTFNYTGSVDFALSNGAAGQVNVTTVTPLEFDASCNSSQASVFASGELSLHFALDTTSGSHATVTWSDCGAPTVVYTAETPTAPTENQ